MLGILGLSQPWCRTPPALRHDLRGLRCVDFRVRRLAYGLYRDDPWRWPQQCRRVWRFYAKRCDVVGWSPDGEGGEERRGKWFFEKNRRGALKMHDEHGRCRCWRAPRPRPRPHRRQNRRRGQQIIKAALSNENTPSTTPAQDVIQVLQTSLQNLLRRTESAEKELQMARERITGGDQLRQLRVTYSICRIDYFQDPTVVMVSSGRSVVHNRLTGHDPSMARHTILD